MNDERSGGHAGSAEALTGSPQPGEAGSALGNDIQAKIGQHLRAMYDDVVRQGVPDRFLDLLSQLDKPGVKAEASEGGGET